MEIKNYKFIKRIFATDREVPSVESIDSFISTIKALNENSWLHFHCKEGIGRTTTFMISYDMIKNFNKVSANDIINRQIELGDFDSNYLYILTTKERIDLYTSFYNYCKKHAPEFNTTFNEYTKNL